MNEQKDGQAGGWMDGQVDGRMDRRVAGWMDGWCKILVNCYMLFKLTKNCFWKQSWSFPTSDPNMFISHVSMLVPSHIVNTVPQVIFI